MSKENIQKAIEEKIAAAQLLAQEYPQYITAEKTQTLTKMVAIFQKMIAKPIMSASMPQGEMGVSAMMDVNPGDVEDLVGDRQNKFSEDLEKLINDTKYIKLSQTQYDSIHKYIINGNNTDFTFTKNHLSSLIKDLQTLIKVEVCTDINDVNFAFVNHYKNIQDKFQNLYSFNDKEAKKFANKKYTELNDAEKFFKKEADDFIFAIDNIVKGLVSNFKKLLDNCTRLTKITKFEDWKTFFTPQFGNLLTAFKKAANEDKEPQYTSIKIEAAQLKGLKDSIEDKTTPDISAYLTNNIKEEDTYIEVIQKFYNNFLSFRNLGEEDPKIVAIKELLETGKDIDLYEIVIKFFPLPEEEKMPHTVINNINNNIANGGNGGNATVENPKEPTPKKKEDTKKDVRSTPILTIGDVAITYDTSSEDHKRILNNYLDKKVTNNTNVHKPFTRINNYEFEFFILRNNASSEIKEVYVVHDKIVNSMLVSSNIIIESSAENSCELSLNLTFISNSKIEREENSGQTNSEHQLSLSSSFGVWVAGFFGYTVGAGKLELDGAYDYFKQYIGANTITKETFEKSQTFKVTLFFTVTFNNNSSTITRILR